MSFLKEMFGTEKPIIGLLHLKRLPATRFTRQTAAWTTSLPVQRRSGRPQSGGVDGVLVTNELSIRMRRRCPA